MTPTTRPLRILHRSYGGDNDKPRPPYYSKLLALASLIRAAQELTPDGELVFINDGPMPAERLSVMEKWGEVRPTRRGGSDSASYREMLGDEHTRPGPDDELIWLAEDDYLYAPGALRHLVAGSAALPEVDYFTLYGSRGVDPLRSTRRHLVLHPEPGAEGKTDVVEVGDVAWYRARATTSTFAIRRGALGEDLRLLTAFALTGGAWDTATCQAVQGFRPFQRGEIRKDLVPFGSAPAARWPKLMARGLVRTASIPLSLRRPSRRRALMGSDPELVQHMEAPEVEAHPASRRTSARIDWAVIAAETTEWARDHGIAAPEPATN